MAEAELAFETEGLRRLYDGGDKPRAALDGVSVRIPRGSFTVVSGRSGSGKTTLLTVLGALDRGYEGRVSILGQDVRRMDERELGHLRNTRLGFVFQSFHLLSHLDVLDNVLLPSLFSEDGRDRAADARRALERVGLASRAKDRPPHLSGGQRQRVALARALLCSPEILLCDEPTGNLDRTTGQEIVGLLSSLHREDGKTVVVVTHDPTLSERGTHRIELEDGRVVQADSAAEPAS